MKFTRSLILLSILSNLLFAQSDWVKWNKITPDYKIKSAEKKSYGIDKTNFGTTITSVAQSGYYILFSEYDGDNCPFYPSCSAFFVQSVKETNIFQGALMFADRFTRDINIFKRKGYYPMHVSGRLFDPVFNYELSANEVKYLPRDHTFE